MTAQTQSHGGATSDQARANDRDLAQARLMRTLSLVLAVAAFLVLAVGFGLAWQPEYQVPAGLAAWAAIEWQRRCSRKIREFKDAGAK